MKASEAQLLEMLRQAQQFEIPLYQRQYSWTPQECKTLWDDVLQAGKSDHINAHFIGSVVHISKGQSNLTSHEPLLVIDGQQRMTSTTLLLKALALTLKQLPLEDQEPTDGFSPTKITKRYLINDDELDHRRYKLVLTQTDRDTLHAIVDDNPLPNEKSIRISENYSWFREQLTKHVEQGEDLGIVCRGLLKLMVVDIALTRDQENPQLIFESMNSTGKELSQADLIRNFVLMGLAPTLQSKLYKNYWRPMELVFGQEAYTHHFDPFVRHYLTIKSGKIPRKDRIYEAFKEFASSQLPEAPANSDVELEELLADLRSHAEYYCAIALGSEPDPKLRSVFADIAELKMEVAYPVLLELYADYAKHSLLTRDELVTAGRTIESYVFRRGVCAIPTNSLNKTFATLLRNLDKSRYIDSFVARVVSLKSYKRFPDDQEFKTSLSTTDSYHFLRRMYLLRKLENQGRKEPISVSDYTIEHVMPQNPNLSAAWRSDLGQDWETTQSTWLHTLGNLTLTGYNSEYSDKGFQDKKTMTGGFDDSPLKLNASVRSATIWNESAIVNRARILAEQAAVIWTRPEIPTDLIGSESETESTAYSFEDHPELVNGAWAKIYQALRTEILALDPTVSETYTKNWVNYSGDERFADVFPMGKGLGVQVVLPKHLLSDPHGLCRDVSQIGRWGTGNFRMIVSTEDLLPSVIGIIRQAFEAQLETSDPQD